MDPDERDELDAEVDRRNARDPSREVRRSEVARDWLHLGQTVDELLRDSDLTFRSERDRQAWVRQAVLDKLRAETE